MNDAPLQPLLQKLKHLESGIANNASKEVQEHRAAECIELLNQVIEDIWWGVRVRIHATTEHPRFLRGPATREHDIVTGRILELAKIEVTETDIDDPRENIVIQVSDGEGTQPAMITDAQLRHLRSITLTVEKLTKEDIRTMGGEREDEPPDAV